VIDLIEFQEIYWNPEDNGRTYTYEPIKPDRIADATLWRDHLLDGLSHYSDGLTELPTPDGMWGEAGITAQIEAICDSPAQVIVDQIMSRAQAEAVLAPQDDITLLVVRMVDGGGM
jgi:hypothetical protein